jgi:hypothetical protein
MALHCIVHHWSLYRETVKFEHVVEVVVSVLTAFRLMDFIVVSFNCFLPEIVAKYGTSCIL